MKFTFATFCFGERYYNQVNRFIGDILESGIELSPVAIMAGKLLAKRLFSNSNIKMDYTQKPLISLSKINFSTYSLVVSR